MWTNERTHKSLEWLQVVKLQKDCYNYCYDCMNWKSQNWLQVSARLGNSTTYYKLRWQHKSYQDLTHIVALMSLVGTCKDLQVRKKFILFYWCVNLFTFILLNHSVHIICSLHSTICLFVCPLCYSVNLFPFILLYGGGHSIEDFVICACTDLNPKWKDIARPCCQPPLRSTVALIGTLPTSPIISSRHPPTFSCVLMLE